MNRQEQKRKREWIIAFGFLVEVFTFIMAGGLFFYSIILYCILGILGVIVGIFVRKLIEKNAVENYKWGLN